MVAPRPARDTASVVDGNGVQGKPKTPFKRVKDFSNTCAVEKNFGTTCGELLAVPKSLVGENNDDTKRGAEGSHFNAESFLRAHSAMQNVEILFFAESVTGSREGMGAVWYALVREEL